MFRKLFGKKQPEESANDATSRMAFLLGVESVNVATSALKTLPFISVEEGHLMTPAKNNLTIIPFNEGALIVLGGEFSEKEVEQVRALGGYEFEGMKRNVELVLARTVEKAMEQGSGGKFYVLTKADAKGGPAGTLRIDTK